MPMPTHCVNLSIASPSEIERTARQLMAIREGFLSTGDLTLWTPRRLILDSWRRCRGFHVNPSRRIAPLAVTRETQLEQLREANALLMHAARPVMNRLMDFLTDSGYVVVLGDAQGRLLEIFGDPAIRRQLERIDFIPGGNWSEAAAGTNAIGTALADGHSVQLMAAEHYCDGWQDLTCTATPIRHPRTDEVIGILDITGHYRLIRAFLTSFLAQAALEIQHRLQMLVLPSHYGEEIHTMPGVPLSLPGNVQPLSMAREKTPPASLDLENQERITLPKTPIHQHMNTQERRTYDAERLVAATSIISASLDLDITIGKVAEQVVHLLRVDLAAVQLFDEHGEVDSTYVQTAFPSAPSDQPHIRNEHLKNIGAIALLQERSEPVIINDTLQSSLVPTHFVEQTGISSLMLLPLVTPRGVSGCILVARCTPSLWTVDEVRLGFAVATQSAASIENARLFEAQRQHNRQIEMLNTISQILNAHPDPGHHIEQVLQKMIEALHIDAGMILLLNPTNDDLTLAARCNIPDHQQFNRETWSWNAVQLLTHRVASLGEPIRICIDDCEEPVIRNMLRWLDFSCMIAVPLVNGDAPLGVLIAAARHRGNPLPEDLTFFSTIGQQLGLTLRNAQLRRSTTEMEALREADRLKSSFLAAVSHDLCSPLTAIRASVESLLDPDGIQSDAGQEYLLRNIAVQANRLGSLVDQLLDLSKIEAGTLPLDRDWIELSALIDDTVDDFERLHKHCHIQKSVAPDLPAPYIDNARFAQVLWNLLENAYKYTLPGSPAQIEIAAHAHGQEVLVSVADYGPGIPQEEHQNIFQRFYRLSREHHTHIPGRGLGLAICKGIIEAHGGRIWVENRNSGGCIFFIALHPSSLDAGDFPVTAEQDILA